MSAHPDPIIEESEDLSLLRDALEEIQKLRAKVASLEAGEREPIAVIGLGCRFPGGVDGPAAYWRVLRDGVDATIDLPAGRWDAGAFYEPEPAAYPRRGGFLAAPVDTFDAEFFGISPREAAMMDPQHRLLLEVTWEGLEHAGLPPLQLAGSRTGVFVGITATDYLHLLTASGLESTDGYATSGNLLSCAAGRLSYFLGLRGPCLAIDTACSSSLVAIHTACQSLRSRACDLALAGGVNLMLSPMPQVLLSRMNALSADGRCKTFDAAADGFARGEGCGMLVLKRLSDARRDGDDILALVRGSAVNHDGRTSGFTVPSGLAQRDLIREALRSAGVAPARVSYVEAHGTGTVLGDPIELEALGAALGEGRAPGDRFAVGSVKTNFGHLESAAGVAGLMKVVLSLAHEQIPPHLHFQQGNPSVPWEELPVFVPRAPTPWPSAGEPRVAGVSSFGMSGTNAHLVLEEAPRRALDTPRSKALRSEAPRPCLLPLSARDEGALRALAARYSDHLSTLDPGALPEVCHGAGVGRSHFEVRAAILAETMGEARRALDDLAALREADAVIRGPGPVRARPRIAFLFTGNGAQYAGMGRRLDALFPVFHEALDACEEILRPLLDRPLRAVMFGDPEDTRLLGEMTYSQPVLFSFEIALTRLWQSWGIEPAAVLGHSTGEYAAACAAGIFSLEEGLRLVAKRGRLMQERSPEGEMVAVFAPAEEVDAALVGIEGRVAIAALNAPTETVISGEPAAVAEAIRRLSARGIQLRALSARRGAHSPLVEPFLDEMEAIARGMSHASPRVPFISNLTGERLSTVLDWPGYWRRHTRSPVRFADGLRALAEREGCDVFLEVGPHPTLAALGQRGDVAPTVWLPSARNGVDDGQVVLRSLGALYAHGAEVRWDALAGPRRARLAPLSSPLPSYPFQRERCWAVPVHAPRTAVEPAAEHFYHVVWQPAPARDDAARAPAAGGGFLVLAPAGGLGERIVDEIERRGERASLVVPGDGYRVEGGRFVLDPARPEDVERLFADAARLHGAPPRGLIHLLGAEETRPGDLTPEQLAAAQQIGCGSVLRLVQALARGAAPSRLWIVTRGAQATGEERAPVNVAQASLWGLGQVVGWEHPELWGGLIDLDLVDTVEPSPAEARRVVEVILGAAVEDRIAFRGDRALVPRLDRAPVPAVTPPPSLRADATYAVVGGLGGLGLKVARWLSRHGARHLALLGRRGPGPAAEACVRELEEAGTRVAVLAADVADRASLDAALATIAATMPALAGVVQSAAVLDDQLLTRLSWDRFAAVLSPKVAGTWNLHLATRHLALDFFVLFSSFAALVAPEGQAAYAAGNAFLDALASHRRALGLAAVSVGWGAWSEVGAAERLGVAELAAHRGLSPMDPAEGLASLEKAMAIDRAYVAAVRVDWPVFLSRYPEGRVPPLLSSFASPAPKGGRRDEPNAPRPGALRERLAAATPAERRDQLGALVRQQAGRVMRLPDRKSVDPHQPLGELGLDSLMAVELRNALASALGCTLSATLVYDHPTADAVTAFLMKQLFGAEPEAARRAAPAAAPAPPRGLAILDALEQMSDEEAEALFQQRSRDGGRVS